MVVVMRICVARAPPWPPFSAERPFPGRPLLVQRNYESVCGARQRLCRYVFRDERNTHLTLTAIIMRMVEEGMGKGES